MTNDKNQLSIQEISNSIKAEIKVKPDGKASMSITGTGRLLGLSRDTLASNKMAVVLTQKLIQQGIDPDDFSVKGIPDVALGLIANYYAYQSKATNKQAELIADFLSAMGARTALQQIVGWKESNPSPAELEVSPRALAIAYSKLADAEEIIAELSPIVNVVNSRSNLLKSITSSITNSNQLTLPGKEDWLAAREIKEVLELQDSTHKIGRHLSATWRSQFSKDVTKKELSYTDKDGEVKVYHPMCYPLPWAKEQLELLSDGAK